MDRLTRYLLDRLTEASTLRGLVIFTAGLAGAELSESDAVHLIAAGQVLAGIIGMALPDGFRRG